MRAPQPLYIQVDTEPLTQATFCGFQLPYSAKLSLRLPINVDVPCKYHTLVLTYQMEGPNKFRIWRLSVSPTTATYELLRKPNERSRTRELKPPYPPFIKKSLGWWRKHFLLMLETASKPDAALGTFTVQTLPFKTQLSTQKRNAQEQKDLLAQIHYVPVLKTLKMLECDLDDVPKSIAKHVIPLAI